MILGDLSKGILTIVWVGVDIVRVLVGEGGSVLRKQS